MGELLNQIETKLKVNSSAELYKENTMYFFEAYKQSSKLILSVPLLKIQLGAFYFLHYKDDSNWMQYSPVFVVEYKKLQDLIIIYAINFNFIPLEIRPVLFDKLITKNDIDKNKILPVNYDTIYKSLLKFGFEYALVEYNLSQIITAHKIDLSLLSDFLYSGHPINKYDPIKLYDIWRKKLESNQKRHQEMMTAIIKDFYAIEEEMSKDYDALKKHADRVRSSYDKYGK